MSFDDFTAQAKQLSNILNGPSKISEKFLKGLWDASEGGDPSARVERAINQLMAHLEKGDVPAAGEEEKSSGGAGGGGGGGGSAPSVVSEKKSKKEKKDKKDKGSAAPPPPPAPPEGSLFEAEAKKPPALFGSDLGPAGMLGPSYNSAFASGSLPTPSFDASGLGSGGGGFGGGGPFGGGFGSGSGGSFAAPGGAAPGPFSGVGSGGAFGGGFGCSGGFGDRDVGRGRKDVGGAFAAGGDDGSSTNSENDWWNQP